MKKQPIELKPGLRIGVGLGRLILSHKTVDPDGLERWAVNYHLTIDGPIRDSFYLSGNVLRYIAKVEVLERDLKSSKEYSRRMKIWKEELEGQLAKSENLRDVAQKTNKQRIDELEAKDANWKLQYDTLYDKYCTVGNQYSNLERDFEHYKKEADSLSRATNMNFKQLHSIIDSEKELTLSLEKSLEYQRFWTFGLFGTSLMFFALWIAAMYF
jgi:hypothetical protein